MPQDYEPIYALIREVPPGEAASYGMIASLLPGVGPRQVARAMRFAPKDLPWFRIITSSGAMADHSGAAQQTRVLKKEAVAFRSNGAVDWTSYRWRGPSQAWLDANDREIEDVMEVIAGWG